MQEGRELAISTGQIAHGTVGNDTKEQRDLNMNELATLWNWAGREANEIARQRDWGDEYTLEEREMGIRNVVTGLRRKLDDSSDEDESDEDEDVAVAGDSDQK